MSKTKPSSPDEKATLHPRNPHRARYDFAQLIQALPALAPFVQPTGHGGDSIDFANPAAVKALNRALLAHFYGVTEWDLPPGYLCPPIPGRADYLHHAADLLASDHGGKVPRGPATTVLDVGVGANCVYPIIGRHAYGWRFVGSEIDRTALTHARRIVAANPLLTRSVDLRHQASPRAIFHGVVKPGESFALSLCNPPFHASRAEAEAGTRRKVRNLGGGKSGAPVLNFGGQAAELWCDGGELAFVRRMIAESAQNPTGCVWFTSLVSKRENLPALERALKDVHAADVRIIPMAQGQKQSRIVAWTFLDEARRRRTDAVES